MKFNNQVWYLKSQPTKKKKGEQDMAAQILTHFLQKTT